MLPIKNPPSRTLAKGRVYDVFGGVLRRLVEEHAAQGEVK